MPTSAAFRGLWAVISHTFGVAAIRLASIADALTTAELQVRQNLHAGKDGGHVMVAVDGRVAPDSREDQQPREAQKEANEDAQIASSILPLAPEAL